MLANVLAADAELLDAVLHAAVETLLPCVPLFGQQMDTTGPLGPPSDPFGGPPAPGGCDACDALEELEATEVVDAVLVLVAEVCVGAGVTLLEVGNIKCLSNERPSDASARSNESGSPSPASCKLAAYRTAR